MEETQSRRVDTSIEKLILTGCIVSDKVLQRVFKIARLDYFTIEHVRPVAKWVFDYYKDYHKAPGTHIQAMFDSNKSSVRLEIANLIGTLLAQISDQYIENQDTFNEDYLFDQARLYFKRRQLEILQYQIDGHLIQGKVDQAELAVAKFHEVAKETSPWVDPFDLEFIQEVFHEENEPLFELPGDLGKFIGPLRRDWLVGIMGPMKRGKTWWLLEIALQAALSNLKVGYITLEMPKRPVARRVYKRLTGLADTKGPYIFPVFDCKRNQEGLCTKPQRTNLVRLYDPTSQNGKPEMLPELTPAGYTPCTYCKDNNMGGYQPEAWVFTRNRRDLNQPALMRYIKAFTRMHGSPIRLKDYPAYSANLTMIVSDLQILEYYQEFIPDVLVVDYADILAPEKDRDRRLDEIDHTWKMLKQIASTRHILVLTGSQSSRKSISKLNITQQDTAEDIRKLAHVDVMIGLNQTPSEKRRGVMRISKLAHRFADFMETETVTVLQKLATGQPFLDSSLGLISSIVDTPIALLPEQAESLEE